MSLINCYECNKQISDMANACPHCGAPIKPNKSNTNKIYIENAAKGKDTIILGYAFFVSAAIYLWGGLNIFFMISLLIGIPLIIIGKVTNWYHWK